MNRKTSKKYSNCDMISSSIGQIVRSSMNEKFREKCYEALKVNSTQKLEEVVNSKLKCICSANDTSQLKKIPITPLTKGEFEISDNEEESIDSQPETENWHLAAALQRKKTMKRRASTTNLIFKNDDKENMPPQFWSQPSEMANDSQTLGKIARKQLTSSTQFVYKSPSQKYLEDGFRNSNRTLDEYFFKKKYPFSTNL